MENQMMKDGGMCAGCNCPDGMKGCKCVHHWVIPILIIFIGLTFLSVPMGWLDMTTASIVWPVLVIIAGLKKLFAGMCKCC